MGAGDAKSDNLGKCRLGGTVGEDRQRVAGHGTIGAGALERRLDRLVLLHQGDRLFQVLVSGLALDQRLAPERPLGFRAAPVGQDDRQRDLAFAEIVADRLAEPLAVAGIVERVVDESDTRRGKRTARLLWGNQASVLVGDFLLGQAFRMMVDVGSLAALKILSNAAAVIAEGEVMQLAAAKNMATTEDAYLAIINAKTAALFAAAAEVGPAIAGRPADEQTALRSFGRNLGIAFQLSLIHI